MFLECMLWFQLWNKKLFEGLLAEEGILNVQGYPPEPYSYQFKREIATISDFAKFNRDYLQGVHHIGVHQMDAISVFPKNAEYLNYCARRIISGYCYR